MKTYGTRKVVVVDNGELRAALPTISDYEAFNLWEVPFVAERLKKAGFDNREPVTQVTDNIKDIFYIMSDWLD